jgi:hypothetical protein
MRFLPLFLVVGCAAPRLNLPDCSRAGYRFSDVPLPSPAVVATVRGPGDFARAIAEASRRGGGAVLVPAGRYRLDEMIRLDRSGIVLRGVGPRTVLEFQKSLTELLGPRVTDNGPKSSEYSWMGGLIHVGPPGELRVPEAFPQSWKFGEPGSGDFVRWRTSPKLLDTIAGVRGYPWDQTTLARREYLVLPSGRLDSPGGEPVPALDTISDVGVENLTIRMREHPFAPHHDEPGYNGIYFTRVVHGWVRDVRIENADNGFIGSAIRNVTVTGLEIHAAGLTHHGTVLRAGSHDNLITDFSITAPVRHGIETEQLSSGNVWRRGRLLHGTFDSHRGMPFDSIRTAIEVVANDGAPGGSEDAGPSVGRRMVHWNVLVHGSGRYVNQPRALSRGTLVGVRGAALDASESRAMVAGDKGTVVAQEGRIPDPPDLFEAQLRRRLGRDPCGTIIRCGGFP